MTYNSAPVSLQTTAAASLQTLYVREVIMTPSPGPSLRPLITSLVPSPQSRLRIAYL